MGTPCAAAAACSMNVCGRVGVGVHACRLLATALKNTASIVFAISTHQQQGAPLQNNNKQWVQVDCEHFMMNRLRKKGVV